MAQHLPLCHVTRNMLELHLYVSRLGPLHLARIEGLLGQAAALSKHELCSLGLREGELLNTGGEVWVDVFAGTLCEEVVELVRQVRVACQVRLLQIVQTLSRLQPCSQSSSHARQRMSISECILIRMAWTACSCGGDMYLDSRPRTCGVAYSRRLVPVERSCPSRHARPYSSSRLLRCGHAPHCGARGHWQSLTFTTIQHKERQSSAPWQQSGDMPHEQAPSRSLQRSWWTRPCCQVCALEQQEKQRQR
jgi:hypothetical protein